MWITAFTFTHHISAAQEYPLIASEVWQKKVRVAQNILLSVIVPVYNTPERYLNAMLASMFDGLPAATEIIMVDDGSEHTTAEMLDHISTAHDAMTVIHQTNGGQNAARNNGVRHAHGTYVAFCDADDILRWDRMAGIMSILAQGHVDAVAFNCNLIDDQGTETPGYGFTKFPSEVYDNDPKRQVLSQCAEMWRNIIRRSLLTEELFDCDSNIGEDLAVVFLALARTRSIAVCDVSPYLYRVHAGGAERSADAKKRVRILDVFDFIWLHLDERLRTQYRQEIEWQAIWHVLYTEMAPLLADVNANRKYIRQLTHWMDDRFPQWRENRYLIYLEQHEGLRFKLIISRRYWLYSIVHRCATLCRNR